MNAALSLKGWRIEANVSISREKNAVLATLRGVWVAGLYDGNKDHTLSSSIRTTSKREAWDHYSRLVTESK